MTRPDALRQLAFASALLCATVAALINAPRVVSVSAGGITLAACLVFARQATHHRRLMRGLIVLTRPGEIHGIEVRLGGIQHGAFVAGLVRPQIFCDARLTSTLDDDELRAVALHEHAHQIARDPLRTALIAAVAPLVRHLPAGEAWLERQAARREIAADRAAVSRGASRAAIASALLKVGGFEPAALPGFATAVDLRLRALLDDQLPSELRPPRRWAAALAGIRLGATLCLLVVHPPTGALAFVCC